MKLIRILRDEDGTGFITIYLIDKVGFRIRWGSKGDWLFSDIDEISQEYDLFAVQTFYSFAGMRGLRFTFLIIQVLLFWYKRPLRKFYKANKILRNVVDKLIPMNWELKGERERVDRYSSILKEAESNDEESNDEESNPS